MASKYVEVWHFYVNTAILTEQNVNRKSPTVNLVSKSVLKFNTFYSSSNRKRNPP